MRVAPAALLALCSALCGLPAVARANGNPSGRCPAKAVFTTPERRLDRLAAAIEAGGPVDILAIGSATTSGQDSSGDSAFPRRMTTALQHALPKVRLRLTVRGGIGMSAAEMLPLIEAELRARHFQLVIWQTGTVEAVRGISSAGLRETLDTGAAEVLRAGTDLVVVGPQFSRVLAGKADLAPYQRALKDAAAQSGAVLFDRLDLTREWVESGRVDLELAARADRQSVLETLHECVGAALARFIFAGAGQPDPESPGAGQPP